MEGTRRKGVIFHGVEVRVRMDWARGLKVGIMKINDLSLSLFGTRASVWRKFTSNRQTDGAVCNNPFFKLINQSVKGLQ